LIIPDGVIVETIDKSDIDKLSDRRLCDVGVNIISDRLIRNKTSRSGIAFARKCNTQEKTMAREKIIRWFGLNEIPFPLNMVTLPGLEWIFERELFAKRGSTLMVHACESDEAIYRGALFQIPLRGIHETIRHYESPSWATATYSTPRIRFYRARVEDLLQSNRLSANAAWLDFSGPLYDKRMQAVKTFWDRLSRTRFAITATMCRYRDDVTQEQVADAGGYVEWICDYLPGAKVREIYQYNDGIAMIQVVLDKGDWDVINE